MEYSCWINNNFIWLKGTIFLLKTIGNGEPTGLAGFGVAMSPFVVTVDYPVAAAPPK